MRENEAKEKLKLNKEEDNLFKLLKDEPEEKNIFMFSDNPEKEVKRREYEEFYASESTKKASNSDFDCMFNCPSVNP